LDAENRIGLISSGYKAAARYAQANIPVTVILDSAIGYIMERVSRLRQALPLSSDTMIDHLCGGIVCISLPSG